MQTPAEFVERWNQLRAAEPILAADDQFRLRVVTPQSLEGKSIPLYARQFLLKAGLPNSTEPEIWLDGLSKGLPKIWEVYGPHQSWSESDKDRLANYFVLGSTVDDDAICIDESRGGEVVVLAHDDYFSNRQFFNSSVMQLAEFLLLFNQPWGENLKSQLEAVDALAMGENSFWWEALNDDKY